MFIFEKTGVNKNNHIDKKSLFIVITGRNFANKTQKSAFFY
nr:MAG TPA: hypothetical protein [Caudoviricetes sp.]